MQSAGVEPTTKHHTFKVKGSNSVSASDNGEKKKTTTTAFHTQKKVNLTKSQQELFSSSFVTAKHPQLRTL